MYYSLFCFFKASIFLGFSAPIYQIPTVTTIDSTPKSTPDLNHGTYSGNSYIYKEDVGHCFIAVYNTYSTPDIVWLIIIKKYHRFLLPTFGVYFGILFSPSSDNLISDLH